MRELALPLAVILLAASILWSGMSTAQAEGPPSPGVVCESFVQPSGKNATVWTADQLATGRRHFAIAPQTGPAGTNTVGYLFCMW